MPLLNHHFPCYTQSLSCYKKHLINFPISIQLYVKIQGTLTFNFRMKTRNTCRKMSFIHSILNKHYTFSTKEIARRYNESFLKLDILEVLLFYNAFVLSILHIIKNMYEFILKNNVFTKN